MWVRNFHNMGASGTEALFIWDDRATEDGGLLRLIGVEIRHSRGGGVHVEKVGAKLSPCTEALVETVGGATGQYCSFYLSPTGICSRFCSCSHLKSDRNMYTLPWHQIRGLAP